MGLGSRQKRLHIVIEQHNCCGASYLGQPSKSYICMPPVLPLNEVLSRFKVIRLRFMTETF